MDYILEDLHLSIKATLKVMARKELKKLSKKELIEFIVDNVDLLRNKDLAE